MGKALLVLLLVALVLLVWFAYPHLRAHIPDDFQKLSGVERVARARKARGEIIRRKFVEAGLPYPAREIFLRIFKHEAVLELWAREAAEPFRLVTSWPILAASGRSGPKRREGDRQVPEGFYEIDRFNPESLYHLSLRLNYPNAADRILADRERPGGDIFIHGKNVTIGCAPIGDEAIEELFVAALDSRDRGQTRITVHVFPARMKGAEWKRFAAVETARDPALTGFWGQLQAGYDAFERGRLVPEITVAEDGSYHVSVNR
jgi:murein L,D-transpeptidase YafK